MQLAAGPGALVGPFCYLRPGTILEEDAKAGTFVELKNTRVGRGAKVPHLSYMGDADIGEGANIGAVRRVFAEHAGMMLEEAPEPKAIFAIAREEEIGDTAAAREKRFRAVAVLTRTSPPPAPQGARYGTASVAP